MDKKILNRDVRVENNSIVVNESIETVLDRNQLESKLRDINMRKMRLQEQNSRLVSEYNELLEEEKEINNLITQLAGNESMEII